MKNYLETVAGIIALASVTTGLQASAFTDIRSDEKRLMHSLPHEISIKTDGQSIQGVTSDNQSRSTTVEMSSATTAEILLQQMRANSRMQAADAAYNLSIIAMNRKDLTRADTLIEESIQLNQSNLNYLTLAADISFLTQKYERAAKYQMMMLEIVRSAAELDDLQVAVILDQLGAIYVAQEYFDKAKSSLLESLQLREKLLGDNHLLVAISVNKLALLAVRQDQSIVAESLLKRSLNIVRKVSGPRHSNSANILINLADFYQSQAHLEEAEVLYEEALSIWDDSPADPLRRARGQNSLGRLFVTQRRFDEARTQFEQVLLLLKQNYAQDHPYIQQAIKNITDLNVKRQSNAEKDRIYDELLREFSSRLPKHKGVTVDITAPLPEQRIMHF